MLMVTMTSDSETLIPCTPIMPHITVHLQVDDQDISHNYMFDPKQGFMLQKGAKLPSSSLSCKFSSEHRQESVKVQIISTNSEPDPSDVVEVSVYRSDNHLDQEVERLEV